MAVLPVGAPQEAESREETRQEAICHVQYARQIRLQMHIKSWHKKGILNIRLYTECNCYSNLTIFYI